MPLNDILPYAHEYYYRRPPCSTPIVPCEPSLLLFKSSLKRGLNGSLIGNRIENGWVIDICFNWKMIKFDCNKMYGIFCNKWVWIFMLDCCSCDGDIENLYCKGRVHMNEGEVTCCLVVSALILFQPTLNDIVSYVDECHYK